MPDTLDVSRFDLPAGALLDAVALDGSAGAWFTLPEQLRDHREQSGAKLGEWRDLFERLYDDAVRRDVSSRFLVQWVAALLEKERAALERLHPLIDRLQQKMAERGDGIDAETQELFQENIDLAFDWITPYQTLCTKLLKLASHRRMIAANEILPARPVAGDIDYAELSREHIARYPKIRAALAK
jgi:hypothetical protein